MHLANFFVLNRVRQRGLSRREPQPPVAPQAWAQPQTAPRA
jgi:hypothetical protein